MVPEKEKLIDKKYYARSETRLMDFRHIKMMNIKSGGDVDVTPKMRWFLNKTHVKKRR